MQSVKPHLALLASPGMGHLIPVLELAERLVSHLSFKVTVFIVSADHASIANSNLLQSPHSHLLHIVLLPFVDLSHLPPDASLTTKLVVMMLESLPSLRSHITDMEFRPTALVVDLFGADALQVADEFNMLKYVFIASNAWFFSVILYSPVIDRKEIHEHMNSGKPLNIPGCKPLEKEDTIEVYEMDPNDPLFEGFFDVGVKMSLTDGILVNSWDELEPTTLKALGEAKKVPIYPIGPLVRPIEKLVLDNNNNQVLNWLDQQPKESVIYVSFGSGGTLSAQQVIELAWGLELSQQRFVWVVRPPTENNASGSFFTVSTDSDGTPDNLPDGFFSRIQDRGLVVPSWAPQVEVLGHPSVGGFLTHCGWNSAMESIVNGVPMIAWPLYAEQKMNAALLTEEIGASIRAKAVEVVGREEIKSMVRKILVDKEGERLRNRVKEMKNSAAKALSEGGSSSISLSRVADVCSQHLKTKAHGA